jgi:hypothetical protein
MGVVQDELRANLDGTQEAHGAEINNLKRRVAALEDEVFPLAKKE